MSVLGKNLLLVSSIIKYKHAKRHFIYDFAFKYGCTFTPITLGVIDVRLQIMPDTLLKTLVLRNAVKSRIRMERKF